MELCCAWMVPLNCDIKPCRLSDTRPDTSSDLSRIHARFDPNSLF
jgi:hypothetical protein